MYALTPDQALILEAAAEYNLFRVCGSARPGVKWADFRTRIGVQVPAEDVIRLVSVGLIGDIARAETLPDGVLAERLDLSEHGLKYYLAQSA